MVFFFMTAGVEFYANILKANIEIFKVTNERINTVCVKLGLFVKNGLFFREDRRDSFFFFLVGLFFFD